MFLASHFVVPLSTLDMQADKVILRKHNLIDLDPVAFSLIKHSFQRRSFQQLTSQSLRGNIHCALSLQSSSRSRPFIIKTIIKNHEKVSQRNRHLL